jgi:hypothetical protein
MENSHPPWTSFQGQGRFYMSTLSAPSVHADNDPGLTAHSSPRVRRARTRAAGDTRRPSASGRSRTPRPRARSSSSRARGACPRGGAPGTPGRSPRPRDLPKLRRDPSGRGEAQWRGPRVRTLRRFLCAGPVHPDVAAGLLHRIAAGKDALHDRGRGFGAQRRRRRERLPRCGGASARTPRELPESAVGVEALQEDRQHRGHSVNALDGHREDLPQTHLTRTPALGRSRRRLHQWSPHQTIPDPRRLLAFPHLLTRPRSRMRIRKPW